MNAKIDCSGRGVKIQRESLRAYSQQDGKDYGLKILLMYRQVWLVTQVLGVVRELRRMGRGVWGLIEGGLAGR